MEQNNFQTRCQEAGLIGSIHSGGSAVAAGGSIPASGGFTGGLVPAGGFIGAAGGFLPAGYTLGGSAAGPAGGGAYAATSVAAATTGGAAVGAAGDFHVAGYSSAAGPAGGGYTRAVVAAAIGGSVAAGSGGGAAAGPSSNKKRIRHTQQQLSALETFLKDYPSPREVQINDLARRLEMDPTQVRYWIQNKRTQMTSQTKREENEALRCENFVLQTEIQQLTEVLSKNICSQCGVSDEV